MESVVSFGISDVLVFYLLPVLLTVYFASWKNCDEGLASKLIIIFCDDPQLMYPRDCHAVTGSGNSI